ncbi:MAG: hypothetical protein ACREA0_15690 [bacterium]
MTAIDQEGNGTLDFVVPELSPGWYDLMVLCVSCAPASGGRQLLPAGEFEVVTTAALPATNGESSVVVAAVAAVMLLGGIAVIARCWKDSSRPDLPDNMGLRRTN